MKHPKTVSLVNGLLAESPGPNGGSLEGFLQDIIYDELKHPMSKQSASNSAVRLSKQYVANIRKVIDPDEFYCIGGSADSKGFSLDFNSGGEDYGADFCVNGNKNEASVKRYPRPTITLH